MDAFLITCGAVGLLAGAFLWAAHTVNIAARWRQREQLRRRTDASWAQTLALLESESAKRRTAQSRHAGGKPRRVK